MPPEESRKLWKFQGHEPGSELAHQLDFLPETVVTAPMLVH
jgi:hypothetical protein